MTFSHCSCCSHEHHHDPVQPVHGHHSHADGHPTDAGHHHTHDGHHHHEEGNLRSRLALIGATAMLLAAAVWAEHHLHLAAWQLLLVYLVPYLLVGRETLHEAWEGISRGDAFNEHFLMSVATMGALAIGFLPGAETQFPEAVFVMLFFQVGELFEGYAEAGSRRSIAHLMDIRPDTATVERDGVLVSVGPDTVQVGETLVVRPGEKIPLDGIVVEGRSSLNTVALTGETLPRDVAEGDEVVSGCVNLTGLIRLRATKPYGESTVAKIIDLVRHAGESKSGSERFIARFARVYTPVVVCAAVAVALLPPLALAARDAWWSASPAPFALSAAAFAPWIYRALMFLVVSCPCALVISVPLTFFGGIGGASRAGILVKGANFMDVLAQVGTVVFDKTGTLTRGHFAVTAVHPQRIGADELLHLAAHVERFSSHPVAAALRDAFPAEATDGCSVAEVEEMAGLGIRARVEGRLVCVGNTKMMDAAGVRWRDCHTAGTIVHVAVDGLYAGHIVAGDELKTDSADAVSALRQAGVRRTVMLTGDRREVAEEVARQLGLTDVHAGLLPADKLRRVDEMMRSRTRADGTLAFVGDGINDAPVLTRADVGIAMGALGSDAAIEAADVVIMDDRPSKVALAVRIARRTIAIARQNVAFAIGVKAAVLLLAVAGAATMWMAVFADVGVTVLAVLNAMRALQRVR